LVTESQLASLVTNNKYRSVTAATASSVSLKAHLLPKYTNPQKGISTTFVSHGLIRASSSSLMRSMAEIHLLSPRVLALEMMESGETQLMVLVKEYRRKFVGLKPLANGIDDHKEMKNSTINHCNVNRMCFFPFWYKDSVC
jgi:hypothetical protein